VIGNSLKTQTQQTGVTNTTDPTCRPCFSAPWVREMTCLHVCVFKQSNRENHTVLR